MTRPLRKLPPWHDLTLLLLALVPFCGCVGLVPLLLAVPLVLCYRAGRRWKRGEPGADVALRKAHSRAMAFFAVGAATGAGLSLNAIETKASDDLGILFALGTLFLLASIYPPWRVLAWLGPSSAADVPEPAASDAIQTSPTFADVRPTVPGDDEPVGTRVHWHTFVTNLLLLTSGLSLLVSASHLYQYYRHDAPPPLGMPSLLFLIPLTLLAATVPCLIAGWKSGGWFHFAHVRAARLARTLGVMAVICTALQFFEKGPGPSIVPIVVPGFALMVASAYGSSRVLRCGEVAT